VGIDGAISHDPGESGDSDEWCMQTAGTLSANRKSHSRQTKHYSRRESIVQVPTKVVQSTAKRRRACRGTMTGRPVFDAVLLQSCAFRLAYVVVQVMRPRPWPPRRSLITLHADPPHPQESYLSMGEWLTHVSSGVAGRKTSFCLSLHTT